MGIYSPELKPGYGRFRFVAEKVNKWNCVFRVRAADQVPAGDYRYRTFVVVGTRELVRTTLCGLHREYSSRGDPG
jgi:hypothetical protein